MAHTLAGRCAAEHPPSRVRQREMVSVMNLRRRPVLGLVLVACLIVVGWWALRSPQTPTASPPASPATHLEQPPPAPAPSAIDEAAATKPASGFATLRGRVIDAATRKAVREFELRFAEWGRTAPDQKVPTAQKFRTDDGRFEWQRLPPGQWSVIAEATGYQRFITDLKLVQGATTPELVVPLVRGYTLRGRVYDQASGAGIASAHIGFHETGKHRFEGEWRLRPRTRSQAGGAFILNGIPPGRITLEVHADNYASRELDVAVDDSTAPLEVALSSGGSIAGRLTAADGATSIAGSASLSLDDGSYSGSSARTNEAGEFSFRNLGPGNYRLTGRGLGGSATRKIALAENERVEGVILALRGGSTIRGTVTGLRPAELKALSINARPHPYTFAADAPASINERGEYELRDVQPGHILLTADVSMRKQLAKAVEVPAGSDINVDIDFPRGARVSGRVTQRGRPVAGAWLEPRPVNLAADRIFNYGASTSATGEYVIEDLEPGEYTIGIDGYKSRPFQVSGDTVFDIDASPQLAGRVLEDNGTVPIAEAQLEVWPADPKSSRIWAFDRSDHYGRFAMAGLEPRDFILTLYKPGYEMFRERIAYVSPLLDMTIRLRRDAGVQVRAHDASTGKPLRKLLATEMLGDRATVKVSVPLDEQGMGYVPSALAGTTLAFWTDGYAPQTVSAWDGDRLDLKFVREQR